MTTQTQRFLKKNSYTFSTSTYLYNFVFFFSLDEVAHIRSVLTKAELEVNNIPKCLEVYNNILIYVKKIAVKI